VGDGAFQCPPSPTANGAATWFALVYDMSACRAVRELAREASRFQTQIVVRDDAVDGAGQSAPRAGLPRSVTGSEITCAVKSQVSIQRTFGARRGVVNAVACAEVFLVCPDGG
jgi:hypothetical protein